MAEPEIWCGLELYHPDLIMMREQIAQWYNDFWGNDTGGVIILGGGVGTGKTHIGRRIYESYNYQPKFYTESEFFSNIWGHFKTNSVDNFIEGLRQSFPLILDDIGTVHFRPETLTFVHENYWKLFDERTFPVLITTNLDIKQFGDWIGERANDRLLEQIKKYGGGFVNLFKVPSYRKKGLKTA